MIKLPFLSTTKDTNKFLTINISSLNVKCLAFYQENGGVKIIGTGKENLETGSVRAGVIIDDEDVSNTVDEAISQAIQNTGEDIDNVIIGVNGDLCLGTMTTMRAKRGTREPISKNEQENLHERISESSYMQIQNEYVETTGNSEEELQTITSSNVYTKIDGKNVPALIGEEGTVIETAIFNAYSPGFYIESLQNLVKANRLKLMAIGSEMYALVKSLSITTPDSPDFVLIDINDDSTNVAVVFGNGILSTKSLSIGQLHFIEGISNRMGLTIRESEKVLKSYITNELTQSESSIVQRSLQDTLEIWIAGIELLFSEFTGVKTFAPKIYLTGNGADIPDLWEAITNEPWTKSIPFKSPPDFNKLTFLDLIKISDATGKVTSSEWLPNASLSIIYLEMHDLVSA